ncbi:MAG: hypothetical protein NTZ35_01760 [Ignavibacteriales bacterium]|nr:hypothetical protein [Ignavibacteriales bacterium]
MSENETRQQLRSRAKRIGAFLNKKYPDPKVALDFSNPLQLLIATILSGVVVDTHVRRVSQRLGLATTDDPEKIEVELMELLPQDDWYLFGNLLVWHGRKTCDARKPDCLNCPIQKLCPSAEEFMKLKK